MTDLRGEAEALLRNATPGPWAVERGAVMDAYRSRQIVLTGESSQDDADAALIAAAPRLFRGLLDELAQARELLDESPAVPCGQARTFDWYQKRRAFLAGRPEEEQG